MKKFIFTLLALMAFLTASAGSYLYIGVNDTLRIKPSCIGSVQTVLVCGHFEGRLDKWDMTLTFPHGMKLQDLYRKADMLNIPYVNYQGDSTFCTAQLFYDETYDDYNHNYRDSLTASIIVPGWWDPNNDGNYVTYGTVKWEAGEYGQLCEMVFKYENYFPDTASIIINEYLSSTMDMRGGTIPNTYVNKRIHLYVGYMRVDVNGDDYVNIADVSTFADYILNNITFDRYQEKAADINGDGIIDIADFTALTDLLLGAGQMSLEDLETL